MKRLAFVAIVLLGLTVSCAPTATPQLQVALASATPQVPTATATAIPTDTPTPTITPSPTSTSTATNTPTPTRTSTPTITPTPTQTPIPKFVWKLDFENGFGDSGTYNTRQGGIVDVIADPTSSGKGKVQRSVIGDGGNPAKEESPGALVYRLYPDKYFSFKPGPCEAEVDVWASKELVETATQGNSVVLLDMFDRTPQDGGEWHTALQAMLIRNSILRGKVYLRLWHSGPIGSIEPTAPEFTAEQWHNIRILMGQNREAILYQDGLLVTLGTMPAENRLGTVGGHIGLYGYYYYKSSQPLKGMLLHDNWQIRCW